MLVKLMLAASLAAATPAAAATSVPDGFTFAAGGDMIGPYVFSADPPDPGFVKAMALFRDADLGFANQEGAIFDLKTFQGYPAAENGGGYPVQPVSFATDLKAMGITVVSKANNHGTDWGTEGLEQTLASLSAAGVAQAGAGYGVAAARGAGYLETRKGRAALVDTASTFPPMSVAGDAVTRFGTTSRPRFGISTLHVRQVMRVKRAQLDQLRGIVGAMDFGGSTASSDVRLGDQIFRASDQAGPIWEMEQDDETAILDSIRQARRTAGFVLFSIHAHQTAGNADAGPSPYQPAVLHFANEAADSNNTVPADFEPSLFHAAIDAGADAVVRTGPHVLGGIEIYKGKPIFYSLGSLFFDFQGRRTLTSVGGEVLNFPDAWFETVIPVTTYRAGRAAKIRLYPMEIKSSKGSGGGRPHPADGAHAKLILERVRDMSAAFGTRIAIKNGIGIIILP